MRKIMMACIASLALSGSVAMAATTAATATSIGVVDVHQIMSEAPQMKALQAKLAKQFKPRQQKLVSLQKKLQANMTKMQRDATIMSQSQKESLQASIIKQRRDLQRQGQDFQQDYRLADNQAVQGLLAKLHIAIDSVAKTNHYDLILQKDSVPYAKNSVDITNKVLKALS